LVLVVSEFNAIRTNFWKVFGILSAPHRMDCDAKIVRKPISIAARRFEDS
jgi:hypothetical protein